MKSEKQEQLNKEKQKFEQKIQNQPSPLDSSGFISKMLFNWVTPITNAAKKYGLSLDMLPNLNFEFTHRRYSNKIRFFFNKLIEEHKVKKKEISKFFILQLLFSTFKYDVFLTLIMVVLLSMFEYSSSFFIQQILTIPEVYDESLHMSKFVLFVSFMIIAKVINSILNDNVYFALVF